MDQPNRPKRGLGALLAATTQPAPDATAPQFATQQSAVSTADVAILSIRPNPAQPRTTFEPVALNELAESIKAQGLIQPVVVRPLKPEEISGDVKYELIAGERRWRASQLAGLKAIPIVVKAVFDERDILLLSLVENLQRDDLNPIEEAVAYDKMAKRFSLTHDQIANGIGKSRAYISNSIRMLELPSSILDALKDRKLSPATPKSCSPSPTPNSNPISPPKPKPKISPSETSNALPSEPWRLNPRPNPPDSSPPNPNLKPRARKAPEAPASPPPISWNSNANSGNISELESASKKTQEREESSSNSSPATTSTASSSCWRAE